MIGQIGLAQDVALIAFAATVVVTDWRSRRIPNLATYPAMMLGLVLAALMAVPGVLFVGGLIDHLAALIAAFVLGAPLYMSGGIKAGDVKLLMAVGALQGLAFLFWAAVYGALLGGAFAIGYVAMRWLRERGSLRGLLRTYVPYGIALGLGALVALVVGR